MEKKDRIRKLFENDVKEPLVNEPVNYIFGDSDNEEYYEDDKDKFSTFPARRKEKSNIQNSIMKQMILSRVNRSKVN